MRIKGKFVLIALVLLAVAGIGSASGMNGWVQAARRIHLGGIAAFGSNFKQGLPEEDNTVKLGRCFVLKPKALHPLGN
jgi:hypothetical protein